MADKDFARAMEFLKLRATSDEKAYAELEEKRRVVAKTVRRVMGGGKGDGEEGRGGRRVRI